MLNYVYLHLNRLCKLVRFKEPLSIMLASLALAYVTGFTQESPLAVISIGVGTAFGFTINNLFDAKYDKAAHNPLSGKAVSNKTAFLVAIVLFVLFLLSLTSLSKVTAALLLVGIMLLVLYSSPPWRLKEKFPYDVLVHSLATVLPVAVVWSSSHSAINGKVVGLFILAFIIGLFVNSNKK